MKRFGFLTSTLSSQRQCGLLGLPAFGLNNAPEPGGVPPAIGPTPDCQLGFLARPLALVLLMAGFWQAFPRNLTIPLQFPYSLTASAPWTCKIPFCLDLRALGTE